MADVLVPYAAASVRMAAAISTLAVSFFYLLAQMAGAGGLVSLLMGTGNAAVVDHRAGWRIRDRLRPRGRHEGTTWVQIIKAALLIAGAALMTFWVLGKYGFNLSNVLGRRRDNSPAG